MCSRRAGLAFRESVTEALAIDPAASQVMVHVGRAGLFGFAGHDHEVAVPNVGGTIVVDASDMSNKEPAKADVLQGTLDVMVLQTLATLGPLHGYAIAARLEQVSSGGLRLGFKRESLEATLRRVIREELPRDLKRAAGR